MSSYPDLDLSPKARTALDRLTRGYRDTLVEVLGMEKPTGPIAYLCLSPGQEEGLDTLPIIYAGRASDRDREAAEGDSWEDAWNPFAMRDEEDTIHPLEEDDGDRCAALPPEAVDSWNIVRGEIEDRCLSAEYWVHWRVARSLNREALPLPATEDFAVRVFDFEASGSELREMLRFALRPETLALLEERGLVR